MRIVFWSFFATALFASSPTLAKTKSLNIECHSNTKFTIDMFPELTSSVEKHIDRDSKFKLDFANKVVEYNNNKTSFKENGANVISFTLENNAKNDGSRLIIRWAYYEINYKKMTMLARHRIMAYDADATNYSLPYTFDVNLEYKCKKINSSRQK